MTSEEHNKFIGIGFLVHGGLQVLMLLFMGLFFGLFILSIATRPGEPEMPAFFFGLIFAFVFLFQLVFTLPSLIAGYAILKKKTWARTASIVAAVLAAMNVPIGTALAVYSFWYFIGEYWKPAYGIQPRQFTYGLPQREDIYPSADPVRTSSNEYVNPPYKDPPDWR